MDAKTIGNIIAKLRKQSGMTQLELSHKLVVSDKMCKMLLSLFLEEAKNALGNIPDDYENKDNIRFDSAGFGAVQLMQCYFTEFLIKLIRNGSAMSEKVSPSEKSRNIASNSL